MLASDTATAKAILRDYINATVGFPNSPKLPKYPPSLMPMLGSIFLKL